MRKREAAGCGAAVGGVGGEERKSDGERLADHGEAGAYYAGVTFDDAPDCGGNGGPWVFVLLELELWEKSGCCVDSLWVASTYRSCLLSWRMKRQW